MNSDSEIDRRQIHEEVLSLAAAFIHSVDLVGNKINPTCMADYEWQHRYRHEAKFHASVDCLAYAMLDYIVTKIEFPDKPYDDVLKARRERQELAALMQFISPNPESARG